MEKNTNIMKVFSLRQFNCQKQNKIIKSKKLYKIMSHLYKNNAL